MSRHSSKSQNSRSRTEAEEPITSSGSNQTVPSYFSAPSSPYISPYSPVAAQPTRETIYLQSKRSFDLNSLTKAASAIGSRATSASMSTYSSSSQESIYSSPGPQQYRVVTPGMMDNPASLSNVSASQFPYYTWQFTAISNHVQHISFPLGESFKKASHICQELCRLISGGICTLVRPAPF